MSDSLQPHALYSPWYSPGQNTRVGSLSILQGIFPIQGSNLGLLHCRQILYQLNHKESPKTLEWVAYPFSSGSSWPRNWTGVSCIASGFFTNWAIREAPKLSRTITINGYLSRIADSLWPLGTSKEQRNVGPAQLGKDAVSSKCRIKVLTGVS